MAAPFVHNARRHQPPAIHASPATGVLLSPRRVADHRELMELALLVGDRSSGSGVSPALAQTAFATLVDNALEHGNGAVPIAAVHLSGSFLTVSSRDRGQAIASSDGAIRELRQRIQVPAEDPHPEPGAPAGIPWLAHRLESESAGSSLLFVAGDGSLTFHQGVWSCGRVETVLGFIAVARIAV